MTVPDIITTHQSVENYKKEISTKDNTDGLVIKQKIINTLVRTTQGKFLLVWASLTSSGRSCGLVKDNHHNLTSIS